MKRTTPQLYHPGTSPNFERIGMKKKNLAGLLALIFGVFGVHRFYLEQKGRGIAHLVLFMLTVVSDEPQFLLVSALIAFIDCIVFWSMDRRKFDKKYNQEELREAYGSAAAPMSKREQYRAHRKDRRRERYNRRESGRVTARGGRVVNPYKQAGIEKFKAYDYRGAIAAFDKALEVQADDLAVHFNLACAHSLTENADRAFYHLDRAVQLGFNDFDRIRSHDALAYLRIQDDYATFERAGFRLPAVPADEPRQLAAPAPNLLNNTPDLLDQLQKLGDLRERGLLTEEEFNTQKAKLLR